MEWARIANPRYPHKNYFYKSEQSDYDGLGLDQNGYDINGYDQNGYDINGYDQNGYDANGYDRFGYDTNGYDEWGYDENGYDINGDSSPLAPQTVNIPFAVAEGDDGGEEYNLNDFTNFTPPVQSLPGRNEFYAAFPKIGTGPMNAESVYNLVGGSILNSRIQNPNKYSNACAIRVSRALNYTNKKIPVFYDNAGKQRTQKGGDNLNYILDAASLLSYMQKTFSNNPPLKLEGKSPSEVKAILNGKWGIYLMIPNDRTAFGASGHADFWSYSGCLSGDYLDSAKQIYFWELY